jgi:hypothetical protein
MGRETRGAADSRVRAKLGILDIAVLMVDRPRLHLAPKVMHVGAAVDHASLCCSWVAEPYDLDSV